VAIFFLAMKTFGRVNGSSAVGAIAYRAGERIRDERTGKIHDFSHRRDVLHKEIVLPAEFRDAAPDWTRERAVLWNAAEAAESRKNARVAREYLVALPAELSPEQQVALARTFSHELAERYRFAVDFAVHAPRDDPYRDPRNFHAHLLATTREVTSNGLGDKTTLDLSERQRFERGLKPSVHEVFFARERWATLANDALREAHIDARIDHRTLRAQGIDREPQPHIPQGAFEIERRGGYSEVAARIREEYQARVQAREQRSAVAQAGSMRPAGFRPQSLDDIRREARENWLRMRAQAAQPAQVADRLPDRDRNPDRDRDRDPARHRDGGRDQDLGR
jgi:ATP-dependent exoDNAse (exonuclease V) alpha subunit